MYSLVDCVDAVACLVCYPLHYVFLRITCVSKLDDDMFILEGKFSELSEKEAQIRRELCRNDGHRPTVNNNFGVWVEDVARIKNQFDILFSPTQNTSFFGFCYCHLRHRRKIVHQLLREVDFLLENTSSLLSYGSAVRESQIFVGKESKKSEQIWECLMDPAIGTIGIYGPGGVGKTTIIMNIANQLANTGTFDKIISVTVSKKVSWEKVGESIALQIGMNLSKEYARQYSLYEDRSKYTQSKDKFAARQVIMTKMIYENLEKLNQCLFIFDDMWDTAPKWIRLAIPEPTRENGFKVVIISRFRAVCEEMGVDKVISLAPLSDEDAWDLFVRETGDQVLHPEIQSIARDVVKECEGLPINVVTISRAMRCKTDATPWRQALNYLQREMQETGMDNILRFCYRSLRNDQIRKCFLYCALFPEDYKFKPQELIRYWMAEDYIHNEGDIVAAIDEGVDILRELQDANMLGMFMEGGNEQLKMHDLIRDFAISIMEEEKDTVAKAGLWLTHFSFDDERLPVKKIKKVSLIGNQVSFVHSKSIFSSLSTLLLKDNPLINVPPSFFSNVPNLQVLDISHSEIALLPPSLCQLPKLRALFLQYCTYLNHIPSLLKLQKLQYLNLSGTLIKELPRGIEWLVNLRSLDLSDTIILEYIHPGAISSLTNLEELHMQGSHICKMDSPVAVERLKEIRCLERLSILTLSAVGFQDHLDTICYLQGHNLKCFSVNVYGTAQDYAEDV